MEFSIIVPVYNSADFLESCVNSVKNQSFNDWELIFIDDGSTDESGKALDEYASSDERILTFHQENSGQFFAREKGIAMSHGEYILFLDSDDELTPDCLATLHETICENKPDMVMFAYRVSYDDGRPEAERGFIAQSKEKLSPKMLCEKLISGNEFNSIWTKAFRRELFDGDSTDYSILRGTHFGEDKIRLLHPVTAAKTIIFIPHCLYRYNHRSESIMHSFNIEAADRMMSVEMFTILYKFMIKWGMDNSLNREKIATYYLRYFLSVYFGFRRKCKTAQDKKRFKSYPWRKKIDKKALKPRYIKKLGARDIIRLTAALMNL